MGAEVKKGDSSTIENAENKHFELTLIPTLFWNDGAIKWGEVYTYVLLGLQNWWTDI